MTIDHEEAYKIAQTAIRIYAMRACEAPERTALRSEQALVGAIFTGAEMEALDAAQFHDPFHRDVVQCVEVLTKTRRQVTIPAVVALMMRAELVYDEDAIIKELVELAEWSPVAGDIREHRENVREASRARRLGKFLARLQEDILLGRMSVDDAKRQLGRIK